MTNFFIVDNLDNRTSRVDAHYFNPIYFETIKRMEKYFRDKKGINLLPINELLRESKTQLTGGATPEGTPYVSEDEGVKFIRVQNVRKYRLILDNLVYIPRPYHEGEIRRSRLKKFDVLLTITGVTYGFSAMVPEDFGEANINQHCVKMEVDEDKIIPEYLFYFLNSELAKIQMDRLITGGTRPALDYPSIREIKVLFPKSKEKQKFIIEKTKKMVDKAYNQLFKKQCIASNLDIKIFDLLRLVLPTKNTEQYFVKDISKDDRIDAIFHSPYYKIFTKILKKYPLKPLKMLVEPEKKIKPNIQEFYSLIDLRNVEELTGRYRIKEVTDVSSDKIKLQHGKIFVSCLNPDKGKSFFVDENLDGCVVSSEFQPLKIISNEVLAEYLVVILRSEIARIQWKYRITGSTPSRERIGITELLDTLIPLPDRPVQKKIANIIYKDIQEVSKLEAEFNHCIQEANNIFLKEFLSLTY